MTICHSVRYASGGTRTSPIDKSMTVKLCEGVACRWGLTPAPVNLVTSTGIISKILWNSCSDFFVIQCLEKKIEPCYKRTFLELRSFLMLLRVQGVIFSFQFSEPRCYRTPPFSRVHNVCSGNITIFVRIWNGEKYSISIKCKIGATLKEFRTPYS